MASRGFTAALAGGLLLTLLAGTAFAQQSGSTGKLHLSLSHPPIMPHTNAIVASRMGIFSDSGLDVERKVLGSADVIRSALTSGDIDVVGLPTDAVIRAKMAGLDWKLIAIADIYDDDHADAALVVRSDSSIKTAKDLENKTAAIIPGNLSELTFRAWVAAGGADISKIRMVAVPYAQVLGSLESKQIDTTHIVEPFLTVGLQKGVIKILAKHLDMVRPRYMISGYIATQAWLDKNPEKAKRFADAITKANQFVIDHPDQVIPVLASETKIDEAQLKTFFPQHYDIKTTVHAAEIQSVIDFMAAQKIIPHSFSYKEIVSPLMPVVD